MSARKSMSNYAFHLIFFCQSMDETKHMIFAVCLSRTRFFITPMCHTNQHTHAAERNLSHFHLHYYYTDPTDIAASAFPCQSFHFYGKAEKSTFFFLFGLGSNYISSVVCRTSWVWFFSAVWSTAYGDACHTRCQLRRPSSFQAGQAAAFQHNPCWKWWGAFWRSIFLLLCILCMIIWKTGPALDFTLFIHLQFEFCKQSGIYHGWALS